MGVVDLLELVRRLWVVRVLVRVELQRKFPEKGGGRRASVRGRESESLNFIAACARCRLAVSFTDKFHEG